MSDSNFDKTQSGTDFGKVARLATMKPLPRHMFSTVLSFAGKATFAVSHA
jgi:hypothetical protein